MAASIIMGALSTATAGVAGTALLGGFLVGGAGTLLTHFFVTTAMGAVLNALQPKPNLNGARGYAIQGESGSANDHQIIYGLCKAGGVRVYDSTTGSSNEYLHRILVFAGHQIDSYNKIYLNDEEVTLDGTGNVTSPSRYNGYVRIKKYLGTTGQLADPDLIAETSGLTDGQWTSQHRLRNLAYLYIRFKYSQDAFPNGIPAVSSLIKGARVYDPRTATTAWSDNTALCIRDYLSNSYGMDQPNNRISNALVEDAADICDEVVEGGPRYTCNGTFLTSATPKEILSNLLTSMGGLLWYSQGTWNIKAAKYVAPTLTLDIGDLRSGISLSTRHSLRENFNTVKGTFRGEETSWQVTDYPSVSSDAFVDIDNGIVNTADYTLPFTTDSLTAQRLARLLLNRNREQLSFSAAFGLRAMDLQVGDNVAFTNSRFGWTSKVFEVTNWTLSLGSSYDLQVNMTLRETSTDVFTDTDGAIFEQNNSNLPDPFVVPGIGVTVSTDIRVAAEQLYGVLIANISSTSPFNVEHVEVQYKKSSDTEWSAMGSGELGIYEKVGLDSLLYDVRARAYNYFGVRGAWTESLNNSVSGLADPPDTVTDFSADMNGATTNFFWSAVTDLDLSHYRMRHALEESGATWSNAVTYTGKIPRPATSTVSATKPGTYMIKAYDKLGKSSLSYPSLVIPSTSLEVFTNNLSLTDSTAFSGTKTGLNVASSKLRITTITGGGGNYSGTYDFTTYIDTGAVRKFRSRIDLAVERLDTSSVLWDDLTGNIDTFSGLFDDLTTAAGQFEDTNVKCFISTTQTNPAGSPVWSAWQEFKAGDFVARAAKFYIQLTSTSPSVTPAISSLVARVQY